MTRTCPDNCEAASLADAELAHEARAGSTDCFAELVSRHEQCLMRFLVRRMRNVHDAEDLLQDTFARAYQHIASYDSKWKFTTWLFTIATRLVCSHYRKKRPALAGDDMLGQYRSVTGDPSADMSEGEQRDKLWALASEVLSANQYTALWFRYAEGMSIADISHVMDKTQTHVKVLLFRGRTTLGKKLDWRREAPPSPLRTSNSDGPARLAHSTARGGG